jgi:hypothetical protein
MKKYLTNEMTKENVLKGFSVLYFRDPIMKWRHARIKDDIITLSATL